MIAAREDLGDEVRFAKVRVEEHYEVDGVEEKIIVSSTGKRNVTQSVCAMVFFTLANLGLIYQLYFAVTVGHVKVVVMKRLYPPPPPPRPLPPPPRPLPRPPPPPARQEPQRPPPQQRQPPPPAREEPPTVLHRTNSSPASPVQRSGSSPASVQEQGGGGQPRSGSSPAPAAPDLDGLLDSASLRDLSSNSPDPPPPYERTPGDLSDDSLDSDSEDEGESTENPYTSTRWYSQRAAPRRQQSLRSR